MLRSFHGKVIVGAGLVFTVTFLLFAYLYFDAREQRLEQFHVDQFSEHADLIRDGFAGQMARGGMDSVRNILDHYAHDPDISDIKVFNSQGQVVISASGLEGQIDSSLTSLDSEFKSDSRYTRRRGKLLSVLRRIGNAPECHKCHDPQARVLGYLETDFRFDPEEGGGSGSVMLIIGFLVLFVFLLSVTLWYFQHRFVHQPLADLMDAIQRVSDGDLTTQAKISGTDEVKRLAVGFNNLVTRLDDAQKQIKVLHEKQMEKVERLATAGELASGIAHEIKNPLAGISSTIQVMLEDSLDDSSRKDIMAEMATQIKRIEKTVKDLLSYACPPRPEFKRGDLNDNIRRCVAFITPAAERQQTSVKTSLADEIPQIYFDPALIDQVMINLLMNALQALKQKGIITVTSSYNAGDQAVKIEVADNGPGIPAQIAQAIFKPFYTTKHKGSGLGLSISKKNIEQHFGTLMLISQPGQGSTFKISLPEKVNFDELVRGIAS